MNCKTCTYSLWKNTTGQCPECGTPFKPSDFDFVPGTVRFCCPHCSQQYFGTDARGQLAPRSFTCVTCQAPIDMDQMVLMPQTGLAEEATQVGKVAWTDPALGPFRRWWRTALAAMIRPHILAAGIQPGEGTAAAWWFAILTNLLITFASFAVLIVLFPIIFSLTPKGTPTPPIWAMSAGIGVFALLVALIGYPIMILLWGLGAHLILHIGVNKPAHSLRHTYATICYASGANAINLIPCIGLYSIAGGLWWTVAAAIGLKFSQRVPTMKAVAAAVVPPLIIVSTCASSYLGFAYFALSTSARMASVSAAQSASTDLMNANVVSTALLADSAAAGKWPSHIGQLVLSNRLATTAFTLTASGTTPDKIALGGTTLAQSILLSKSEERRLADGLTRSAPPPIYRFGDFVFTYQGVPVSSLQGNASRLWIVIASVDPNSGPPPPVIVPFGAPATSPNPVPKATARTIYAGTAGGGMRSIAPEAFPAELAAQNVLRASFGLPPIPLPETVPQWTLPATAPN